MSEENKHETTVEIETETVDPSAEKDVKTETEEVKTETVDETDSEEEKFIPYKRFKEINDKYKDMKAEFDKLKADASQQTNEAKNETTVVDPNEVVTEVNPLQEKVSQYEAVFNELFQSKLKQVPEAYHDLIPEGDSVSKLNWIENALNKGLFTANKPQDFGGLGANPVPPTVTKEKFLKMTHAEKAKLKQEDESLYNQLLRQ